MSAAYKTFDDWWKKRVEKCGDGFDCGMCKSLAQAAFNAALRSIEIANTSTNTGMAAETAQICPSFKLNVFGEPICMHQDKNEWTGNFAMPET